ncbi:MAG: iron chelate uptake ABC transporter family permease subunit [Myxococcota bacterium]|nr:iron chelate uptake ABC transporter family permease subunit [Myxococcota bacterium]
MSETLLQTNELRLRRGPREVLQGIDFELQSGEWIALVGPNGAGKSSFLRCILGLESQMQGSVQLDGVVLSQLDRRSIARKLAFVPQRLAQLPPFSIAELVLQSRAAHRRHELFDRKEDHAIAQEALHAASLQSLASRRLDQVSGGEAQRALLAAAMAQCAPILLLDEPSSALDPYQAVRMLDTLRALQGSEQTRMTAPRGVLMATHDINLASRYCDKLALMVDGRIVMCDTPERVLQAQPIEEVFGAAFELIPDAHAPVLVPKAGSSISRHDSPEAPTEPPLKSRAYWPFLLLGGLATAAILALPAFGSSHIEVLQAWSQGPHSNDFDARILWQLRLPRVLMAFLAGAVLAVAGAVFQGVLRNPLATPYTLGIAGGSSLAASMAIVLGLGTWMGASALPLAAFAGAIGSLALVLLTARSVGRADSNELLLAGIAWSIVAAAGVSLFQSIAEPHASARIVRWMIGGLQTVGVADLYRLLPWVLGSLTLLFLRAGALNLLAVDEDLAAARGLDVPVARRLILIAASLAVAAVVSQVGPIGFVGLIVPHGLRPLFGADHRRLLPACALAGGSFLASADTLARVLLAPAELPVGVLTALTGGPALLLLLLRARSRS